MNTTKKIISAIAAIVLIVSVAMLSLAFKASNNKVKAFASQWYEYDGSGLRTDATNYNLLTPQPANEAAAADYCPESGEICLIFTEGGTGNPNTLPSSLQSEINTAKSTGVETENVKLRF